MTYRKKKKRRECKLFEREQVVRSSKAMEFAILQSVPVVLLARK